MNNKQLDIVKFVSITNWVIFFLSSLIGVMACQVNFALGIILGGLIVTINFHLLEKTLKKNLLIPEKASSNIILIKYYIRFIISGVIIFLLIATHAVHPFGLLIGLSVVVVSISIATIFELKNFIIKEAV